MSQVSLPAYKVRKACERFLDKREKIIDAERAALVLEAMQIRTGWPWARRNLTQEEALQRVRESDDWLYVEIRGGKQAKEVQALLNLAELTYMYPDSDYLVTVDSSMAAVLTKYWD